MNGDNYILPEGLIWDNTTSKFLFVDIKLNSIFQIETYPPMKIKKIHTFDESIGFIHCLNDSEILCGMKSGLMIFNRSSKVCKYICNISKKNFRLNDGFVDKNDIAWFGQMHENDLLISDKNKGTFYSFNLNKGTLVEEDNDYLIPNGPVISPDNKWIYHSDSSKGIIYRYKYSMQNLNLDTKEIFLNCNHYSPNNPSPDGMIIDRKGNLVVAIWGEGEVWIISTEYQNKIIKRIKIPAVNVTNVCFSDQEKIRAYVTYAATKFSSGGIYELPSSEL